jgi:tol-pal system protein YbgF
MRGKKTLRTVLVTALVVVFASLPLQAADKELEQRLSKLERLVQSQGLADMYLQLEDMRRQLQEMRGLLEEQRHDIDNLKKQQRDLYLDVDRRLQQVEQGAGTASTPPPAAVTPPAPAPVAPAPVAPAPVAPAPAATQPVDAGENAAYRAAFNYLKEGRYDNAIKAFADFLGKYPRSSYADNAQYWLGEAHYVTRQYPGAIVEFQKVVSNYPNSPKLADAMLKIGYCHYELRELDKASAILQELQQRYPRTTAARLAEKRLQRIKIETR